MRGDEVALGTAAGLVRGNGQRVNGDRTPVQIIFDAHAKAIWDEKVTIASMKLQWAILDIRRACGSVIVYGPNNAVLWDSEKLEW